MHNPSQVSFLLGSDNILAKILQATEVLFLRRLDGAASAASISGLDVTESTWGEWEQVVNGSECPKAELKARLNS